MFEIIGMAVVAWLGYHVIKITFRSWNTVRRMKIGEEARRIALEEMGLPSGYYNFMVLNKIDIVKFNAQILQHSFPQYEKTPWPRYIALSVLDFFIKDCKKWGEEDPEITNRFYDLDVGSDHIGLFGGMTTTQVMEEYAK